jgi:hypothetical protein
VYVHVKVLEDHGLRSKLEIIIESVGKNDSVSLKLKKR